MDIVTVTQNSSKLVKLPVSRHSLDNELSEELLARRFRTPAKAANAKTVFEFTHDAALLQQYIQMREEMFISVWGLKHFCGQHDKYDDISHILIARKGNHCVAGGRLTICHKGEDIHLPMEGEDFNLRSVLPELNLGNHTYGEFSRLAILPEFRAGAIFPEMARRFIQKAISDGVEFAFNMAPRPLARSYRQTMQLFGLQWDVLENIAIPERDEFEGISMVLSRMDLRPYIAQYGSKSEEKMAELAD